MKLLAVQLRTLDNTVLPKYQRWLAEASRLLADSGLAHTDISSAQAWQEWAALSLSWHAYADMQSALALADTCLKNLPAILRGEVDATDILFAKSELGTVQTLYSENPVVDYFNQAVAELVRDYIAQRIAYQPDVQLRLLEIGAGTGGTTLKVLPALKPFSTHIAEYLYTDISKAFLTHGEQQFKDYAFLRSQLCNIEQAPDTQGLALGAYDIVIATNVLHATQDISQSVFHAKQLLVQNGLLLINENCRKITLSTLTFGLLDGWWRYQDMALRIPGSPLLTEQRWLQVLSEQGFNQPGLPVVDAIVFGQQIIMATSDGLLKQNAMTPTAPVMQRSPSTVNKPKPVHQSVQQAHAPISLLEYVNSIVLTALATSLKLPSSELTSEQTFSDLGIDSILGVNFVADINHALGLNLNTAIIFDYTTAALLSQYLVNTYSDQLIPQYNITPPPAASSIVSANTQDLIKTRLHQQVKNAG
ncbi:methyltransferase [Methylocucumis oryzae]|uniref:Carrier domain-containing protein n=1 Tax=Methylocucumis oryzae TaxID=1632867 RepID=A0A0F3IH99_9GAMM|nr:methyltransferase [Methylocucumis oryzae]KJV06057.1 hypothetical protein VZ94_13795 [Methylocucumis oryzae]